MFIPLGIRARIGVALAFAVASALVLGLVPVRSEANAAERFGPRLHMLALTNDDRRDHDRRALSFAARLSRYAKEHSRQMANRGEIFHSSEEQLREALEGHDWTIGGENVGVGESLESLEDAFMASKLHRQNILRASYDRAAVGAVRADGRLWVTVIFYG